MEKVQRTNFAHITICFQHNTRPTPLDFSVKSTTANSHLFIHRNSSLLISLLKWSFRRKQYGLGATFLLMVLHFLQTGRTVQLSQCLSVRNRHHYGSSKGRQEDRTYFLSNANALYNYRRIRNTAF